MSYLLILTNQRKMKTFLNRDVQWETEVLTSKVPNASPLLADEIATCEMYLLKNLVLARGLPDTIWVQKGTVNVRRCLSYIMDLQKINYSGWTHQIKIQVGTIEPKDIDDDSLLKTLKSWTPYLERTPHEQNLHTTPNINSR